MQRENEPQASVAEMRSPPPTLAAMVTAGHYDDAWAFQSKVMLRHITEGGDVDPLRYCADTARIYAFEREMTEAEVRTAMDRDDYEPAGLEVLLAFGADANGVRTDFERALPALDESIHLLALGHEVMIPDPVEPPDHRKCPAIRWYCQERMLYLHELCWQQFLPLRYRFIAVPKSTKSNP